MKNKLSTDIEKIHNLTYLQEGMLLHYTLDEKAELYFIQSTAKINGEFDLDLMKKAIGILAYKHEVLRSAIAYRKVKNPLMIVMRERMPEINILHINSETDCDLARQRDIERGFEVEKDTLWRICVIERGNDLHEMIWSFHHIIVDGWSISVILNDFKQIYNRLKAGQMPDDLKQKAGSYEQYVQWLRNQNINKGLAYWENLLAGYEESAEIPSWEQNDKADGVVESPPQRQTADGVVESPPQRQTADGVAEGQFSEKEIILGTEITNLIKRFAKQYNVTLNVVVETALGILLQKYNHNTDVVFGKVVSGRNADLEGINEIAGLFINTIPVRVNSDSSQIVGALVSAMQQQALESQLFDYCSLAEIQDKSVPKSNLIKVLFSYENYFEQVDESPRDGLDFQICNEREQTHYDLTVLAYLEESLAINMMYNQSRYSEAQICQLLENMKAILTSMAQKPDCPVSKVEMISQKERQKVLFQFNESNMEYPKKKSIVQLFEEQVKNTPDHVAVIFKDESITYEELNQRANSLAVKLRNSGIKPNDFVLIMTERSIEMIIGIYGIIKSGAAYVPVDVCVPKDRLQYMIKDCKPKACLIGPGAAIRELDDLMVVDLVDCSLYEEIGNPEIINTPEDLLYLIYTSGTTGVPKAVMNKHKGIVNLTSWMQMKYPLSVKDVMLQKTSYTFDVSVSEILWWNFVGARVVMLEPGWEKEPSRICDVIAKNKVTAIDFAPSMLSVFLNHLYENPKDVAKIKSLKYVFAAGEALNKVLVDQFYSIIEGSGNTSLINLYGPTEASVYASYYDCKQGAVSIPIGKPIGNTQFYVMNEMQLCGIGVPGELYIAGEGVAKGYLNQSGLTAEKFVDNPFGTEKIYRTGDLVRWHNDGNLEYMGRLDDQIKIRGFRIELGEVEAVLRNLPGIKNTAVVAKEDSNKERAVFAYFESDRQIEIKEIRSLMKRKLPDYMIPAYFMQIDEIPVNQNGKVDRKKLPQITLVSTEPYAAPGNETEQKVANAFQSILDMDQIGIYDNFFDLGGHSLKATRLVNLIEAETGIRLFLKDIFGFPTVAELAGLVIKSKKTDYVKIPKADKKEYYPMSSSQKRMFLYQEFNPQGLVYNMPVCYTVGKKLVFAKVQDAFEKLIARHEILRTGFKMLDGEPVQFLAPPAEVVVEYKTGADNIASLFDAFIKPFSLETGFLIRMMLVETRSADSLLFIDLHHIISDGVSSNILIDEFCKLYNDEKIAELEFQFCDYSEWMSNRSLADQKEFWLKELGGQVPVLELPIDYKRPAKRSYAGETLEYHLSKEIAKKLKLFIKSTKTTDFMVLISIFMVLLQKYSRQEDLVIGSPISGRTHKDTESMLGMFVNTLVFRGRPQSDKVYADFLQEIRDTCIKVYQNQEYPFEELVEDLAIQGDQSRNPIFDVMFVFQNEGEQVSLLDGAKVTESAVNEYGFAKFDLTINVMETEQNEYQFSFEYCTDLFCQETIRGMIMHYEAILQQVLANPYQKIGDVKAITAEEQQKILGVFNDTNTDYPSDQSIPEIFEEQVKRIPDHTAVCYNQIKLTYRQLNDQADQVAMVLKQHGVQVKDMVAVLADKSVDMIAGILGILKAGGAYVPIDLKYPQERIVHILKDCKPKVVLINQIKPDYLSEYLMIDLQEIKAAAADKIYLESVTRPDSLAYLIYTSGSTGKPKGTMIEHKNVIRLVKNTNYIHLDSETKILQTGALAFDASTFEMWGSLLNGGTLYLADQEVIADCDLLKKMINEQQINTMWLTATLFNQMVITDAEVFAQLNILLIGGERLSEEHVRKFKQVNKKTKLINGYGPTENTTFTTTYEILADFQTIPIGKPISNTRVYVLNGKSLCGIGVPGELCIAGDGLARGYLHNPGLTAQKFIDNPFGEGKLYRSGDLVKWKNDGNIEFIGRLDEQVKIRGFRIELGEIESVLRQQAGVKDAVAIVHIDENGDKSIWAYYAADTEIGTAIIKDSLRKQLPEYMIPSYLMELQELPANQSGKVDKARLPVISRQIAKNYQAPETNEEKILAETFEFVLGVSPVGINDDFFELGGDSIKAIRIVSKVREYQMLLTLKDIINGKKVRAIAAQMKSAKQKEYLQDQFIGNVGMTPIQQAFFYRWKIGNYNYFNQTMMLNAEKYDIESVRAALNAIVVHHDMLRAVYRDQIITIQSCDESKLYDFYEVNAMFYNGDDRYLYVARECTKIQAQMDIEKGPLVKAALIKTKSREYLMFCIHHLAVDAVSWQIILEDFESAYLQHCSKTVIELPQKTASYSDWVMALNEYAKTTKLKKEIPYWKTVSIAAQEVKRFERQKCVDQLGFGEISFCIDEETTKHLLFDINQKYKTDMNDILLTGLILAMKECTEETRFAVNLEGHGREELHRAVDISRTVGWFTTAYPVVLEVMPDLESTVISTKETLKGIPNKGLGYGILREEENLFPIEDLDISFNYFGQIDTPNHDDVAELSAGDDWAEENILPGSFIISAVVTRNQLNFNILYSLERFSSSFADQFINCYMNSIHEIVEYIMEDRSAVKTLSDIGAKNVVADELDKINSIIGELIF